MLRVGLTGGIGCGKTTIAGMMRLLGCYVINADKIAHEMMEPGQAAYDRIVQEFGTHILAPGGCIDRPRLAAVVFGEPDKLARLNAIVHPLVLQRITLELDDIEEVDPTAVAVVEAALLIEAGYHRRMDRLVVAVCSKEDQMERLTNPQYGRNMSREDAERRIAAQLSLEERRALATDEIDCSGTLEETRRQVTQLVSRLKQRAAL